MEATNFFGQPTYAGQPAMATFPGYPNPFNPQMYAFNNNSVMMPNNNNALTSEEIQRLMNHVKPDIFDLNVSELDVLKAFCTHKKDGQDVVQLVQDGSGYLYCPICQETWNGAQVSFEDAQEAVNILLSMMQNAKWTGEFPANVVREYYSMIPLLKKFPQLYKYANDRVNRMFGQSGYMPANEVNSLAQYNSLFGIPSMGVNPYQQQGYPWAQNQQMMYGQPQMPNQATQQNQVQVGNPTTNPMQQTVYAVPPAPGFNPQFANQNQMMMNGGCYQQAVYTAPPAPTNQATQQQTTYGNTASPVFSPAAPQAQTQTPTTAVTEAKVDL